MMAARRGSLMDFMNKRLKPAIDRPHAPLPAPEEVRRSVLLWDRIAHCAALLGYAQLNSAGVLLYLVYISTSLDWTIPDLETGVPVLNNWAVLWGIYVPANMANIIGFNWAILLQFTSAFQLLKKETQRISICRMTVVVALLVTLLLIVLPSSAALWKGVDMKYYGLDLLTFLTAFFISLIVSLHLANKFFGFDIWNLYNDTTQKKKSTTAKILTLVENFNTVIIVFVYPYFLIPTFFAGTTQTKLCICLGLHPVLLEAAEALGRGMKSDQMTAKLWDRKITLEHAEKHMVQTSLKSFTTKQQMAMYRRLMLLSMGDPTATLVAVVASSLEESVTRGFLVEIDRAIRRLRGLPPLQGDELRLQRLVWMCDANQSAIAELNAIMVSSFAQVLLQQHALVFALGYSADVDKQLDVAVVFVQLMLELGLEVLVDNVAVWSEVEHGIPVTHYFARNRSSAVIVFHTCTAIVYMALTLFAFIRHPFFLTCDSSFVCDCIEAPQFFEWLGPECALAQNSNATNVTASIYFSTNVTTSAMFENVNPTSLLIAVVTGVAMLSLITLSVLFASYRKRVSAVGVMEMQLKSSEQKTAEAESDAAAAQLEVAQVREQMIAAQKTIERVMAEGGSALSAFELQFSDIAFGEAKQTIGEGSFGTVFKATFRGEHAVAVKTMRVSKVNKRELVKFKAELAIMCPLHHVNLVRLYGGVWNEGADKLCIVLEFCADGSLSTFLVEDAGTWVGLRHGLALGSAKGLRYLHHDLKEPLIHRDIKPDNVLVGEGTVAKLADFGESTRFDTDKAKQTGDKYGDDALTMSMVGTQLYCPPEIMIGERYNESADTFSFALVLLCLCVGDIGYVEKLGRKVTPSWYVLGRRPAIPALLNSACPDLTKLIAEMWDGDFRKRPSLKVVVPRLEATSSATLDDFDPVITREEEVEDHAAATEHALRAEMAALVAANVTLAATNNAQAATIETMAAKIASLESRS